MVKTCIILQLPATVHKALQAPIGLQIHKKSIEQLLLKTNRSKQNSVNQAKFELGGSQPIFIFSSLSLYKHMYYTYERERDLHLKDKDTHHCFGEIKIQLHLE